MESIQLAQMLADLSDLNAAQEAQAALALVNANKPLAPPRDPSKPSDHEQRQHPTASPSGIISWTASPAKFDKYGRRILTPPITRTNSSQGAVPGTPYVSGTPVSGTSTPRGEFQADDDVARATSLMQLYEIRARLKQQDTSSLNKARERINAIQARQQLPNSSGDKREPTEGSQSRFTYPKTP